MERDIRRVVHSVISFNFLTEVLKCNGAISECISNLPSDASVVDVIGGLNDNSFTVLIHSKYFKPVINEMPPRFDIYMHRSIFDMNSIKDQSL